MCQRCAALEAQNAKLLKLLGLARKILGKQNRQLDDTRGYAWMVHKRFEELQARGGVPRPEFHRWQGRDEVAVKVYNILIIDWSTKLLEILGRIQGL